MLRLLARTVAHLWQQRPADAHAIHLHHLDLAHYISKNGPTGLTLTVPDSLHLATAILYRATEFHTFDENDKPKQNALGLLPLSGDVAGHKLKICKPEAKQFGLNGI